MAKQNPKVAIVILNWNGKHLLEAFLPSVIASNYDNLDIIVADNASSDGSIEFLNEKFPKVRLIKNEQNFGFAEGYNQALKHVDADYYILLNSDVEVPQNWIEPVISMMESEPQIAIAQPKIKWQKEKTSFEYAGAAGGFIDHWGFTFCRGRIFDTLEKDLGQYNDDMPVFWASGAALFIKQHAWNDVGGFDGDLFAHMEEIDLCWRLKNRGYEVQTCSESEIYHLGGGTLDAGSPFKNYLNFRNNLIIMQKNLSKGEAFVKIFVRLWFDLAAWFQFAAQGKIAFAFSINKAHYHFFKQVFITAKKRDKFQLAFKKHSGVYPKSVVLKYFLFKKKRFSEL
jgi:hypothetical protein